MFDRLCMCMYYVYVCAAQYRKVKQAFGVILLLIIVFIRRFVDQPPPFRPQPAIHFPMCVCDRVYNTCVYVCVFLCALVGRRRGIAV